VTVPTPGEAAYEAFTRVMSGPDPDPRAAWEAAAQASVDATVQQLLTAAGVTLDEVTTAVTAAIEKEQP
jgi:hypothetical protein